ncbi:MAG: PfkB family carbohydrate kinase [Acholeplasmataceae bacterium]
MIIGIGGVNIDFKYTLHSNKLHSSNEATLTQTYGGVIRNVLENLGKLNQDVYLVSFIGDDYLGKDIINYSKQYMDVSLVEKTDKPTGTYVALSYQQELLIGASSIDLSFSLDYLKKIEDKLIKADMLIFDSNLSKESISYLIELGSKHHIKTILIGVSVPKMKNLPDSLAGLYLSIHNMDEIKAYLKSESDGLSLNKTLKQKGVKHSIITDGKNNLYYNTYQIQVKENKQILDSTGLGDAFSSGVIYGDIKGYTIEYACVIGNTNSYYTTMTIDSVRRDLSEEKLLKEVDEYYD